MDCPVCGRSTRYNEATGHFECPACGWGTAPLDAAELREVVERASLAKEAHLAQLAGAMLISGGVVFLLAFIVFDLYRVEASLGNILLFTATVVAYGAVGWLLGRKKTIAPLGYLGRVGSLSPVASLTGRLFIIWLLLLPGRLMALGAVGAYRFIKARRRLREMRRPWRIPSPGPTKGGRL